MAEIIQLLMDSIIPAAKPFLDIIAYAIATASAVVKITPTLKDDDVLKKVIKFIGKYIALDKYGPNGKE